MQFNAVILSLAALNSVVMGAPKVDQPFSSINEVEKRFPGAKASFDNQVAGQLENRALGKRCIYDAPDTCIQCNANCSDIHETGAFLGCMIFCYTLSKCC